MWVRILINVMSISTQAILSLLLTFVLLYLSFHMNRSSEVGDLYAASFAICAVITAMNFFIEIGSIGYIDDQFLILSMFFLFIVAISLSIYECFK